jgi:hypothetical protein
VAFLFLGGVLGGFSNQVTILDEEFLLKITYVWIPLEWKNKNLRPFF